MLSSYLTTILFTYLLASSAHALATPKHVARDVSSHADLVARVASQANVLPLEARSSLGAKRLRKRCKPKIPAKSPNTPANPEAAPAPPTAPKTTPSSQPVAKPPTPPSPPKTTAPKPKATPKPSTPPAPKPKPPAPPPPPPPPSGNPILNGPHTGDGTFYSTGLDACGDFDRDTDFIAAIGHQAFDQYPGSNGNSNQNPICGRRVTAHYQGRSVTVQIKDRCAGCAEFSLDFSPSAFQQLAPLSAGRITGVTWNWA